MWYIMSAPIILNTIKRHPGNAAKEGIIVYGFFNGPAYWEHIFIVLRKVELITHRIHFLAALSTGE
jgi:hypothetical protein